MPPVVNWVVWAGIFIVLIWFLVHMVRRPNIPIPRDKTTVHENLGFKRQECDSCGGMGAKDLTRPSHILRREEAMTLANQITCRCCTGLGYHMVKPEYGLVDCA